MITYWVNADHRGGFDRYLRERGRPLAGHVEVREYEELSPVLQVAAGAHIFSALDQLGEARRAAVAHLADQLALEGTGMRCLNDPRKVLLRHDLLTKLAENGINRFRVRRATESKPGLRFPLFVREENAHTGPLTPLLRDSRSLSRALLALRMRGHRTRDLLVIEHENLADQAGLIRKAAAFKVGDTIVAAHLLISRDWIIKWGESIWTEETLRSHLEYATANPHRHWLEGVFSLGGIDYGRCDYGICGEIKEVWEINLNATIGFGPGPTPPPLRPELEAILDQIREVHHGRLQIAFRDLDPEQSRERITIKLDPAVVAKARAERARQRRRAGFWRLLHSAYASPVLGWPFRAAYAKFLPGPSRAR